MGQHGRLRYMAKIRPATDEGRQPSISRAGGAVAELWLSPPGWRSCDARLAGWLGGTGLASLKSARFVTVPGASLSLGPGVAAVTCLIFVVFSVKVEENRHQMNIEERRCFCLWWLQKCVTKIDRIIVDEVYIS